MRKRIIFALAVIALLSVLVKLCAVNNIWLRSYLSFRDKFFVKDKIESTPLSQSLAHYMMGIIYDNESRPEDAINEYLSAIKIDPNIGYIHTRLAADYFLINKRKEALDELALAKELDPKDDRPRFISALIHTSMGSLEDAQREYQEIVRINPGSLWALSSLADIFVVQEKMNEAASVYEELIDKEEDSDLLRFNLGVIYSRIGRIDEAISSLEKAVEMNPKYLEAYIGLGVLYMVKSDLTSAIASYEKAIEIDPVNIPAYHQLADALYKDKRYKDAEDKYRLIIKLNPEDAYAYIKWAAIYMVGKKEAQAIEILDRAVKQGIENPEVYLALGYAHSLSPDKGQDPLIFYQRALELKSDNPRAYFYIGAYYDQKKDRDSAERNMREAIRLNSEYAEAYNYLGYMFAESGTNLDEALELINKALEFEPDNGAYLDSLAWVYYKMGRIDQALTAGLRALEFEPDDPIVRDHMGDIYMKKGLADKAIVEWKKSLELDPGQGEVRKKIEDNM